MTTLPSGGVLGAPFRIQYHWPHFDHQKLSPPEPAEPAIPLMVLENRYTTILPSPRSALSGSLAGADDGDGPETPSVDIAPFHILLQHK